MLNYSEIPDNDLAALLKGGDQLAYKAIYTKYTGIFYRHAYLKLQDRQASEDIVQDLFLELWANRDRITFTSNFSGYLYSTLRNKILNLISKSKVSARYLGSLQDFMENGEADTDSFVRLNELGLLIEKEIIALPPKMRYVFELSRKEHLSHREIAAKLGLSEKTVRNHINHALKILKIKIGPMFLILQALFFYFL